MSSAAYSRIIRCLMRHESTLWYLLSEQDVISEQGGAKISFNALKKDQGGKKISFNA